MELAQIETLPFDPRFDAESWNDWIVAMYERGSADLSRRLDRVFLEFLDDLTDEKLWPPDARIELLDCLQLCGDRVAPKMFELLQSEVVLQQLGKHAHASLIKTFLATGHLANIEFWLKQRNLLGEGYGALIFSGLAKHSLGQAFFFFSNLVTSDVSNLKHRKSWPFCTPPALRESNIRGSRALPACRMPQDLLTL